MFGLFDREQRKLEDNFHAAYVAALESPDPKTRIQAGHYALSVIDDLKRWPLANDNKRITKAKLYSTLGMTFQELIKFDPDTYSPLCVESLENAGKHFQPSDGNDWLLYMMNLSIMYSDRADGNPVDNLERAIELAEKALNYCAPEKNPDTWLRLLGNLGSYYSERQVGNSDENHRKSVEYYELMLSRIPKMEVPLMWAQAASMLGAILTKQGKNSSENIEKGIGYIKESIKLMEYGNDPISLAVSHTKLASAYADRLTGSRQENIELSIHHSRIALKTLTPSNSPIYYKEAKFNYASMLAESNSGDLQINHEKAVSEIEDLLEVFTSQHHPLINAELKHNLLTIKTTYLLKSGGLIDDVLDECRELAEAMKYELSPSLWGTIQNSFGACLTKANGNAETRSKNLEEAIAVFENALQKFPEGKEPHVRSLLLNNLSNALAERATGTQAENIEQSIKASEEGLLNIDVMQSPRKWVLLISNLADLYRERIVGSKADNVEMAIALLEEAAVLSDRQNYTSEFSRVMESLGEALAERMRGDPTLNHADAKDAFEMALSTRDQEENPEAWMRLEVKAFQNYHNPPSHSQKTNANDTEDKSYEDADAQVTNFQNAAFRVDKSKDLRTWAASTMMLGDLKTRMISSENRDNKDILSVLEKQFSEAISLYREAHEALGAKSDQSLWTKASKRLAATLDILYHLLANQSIQSADSYLKEAVSVLEELLELIPPFSNPKEHMDVAIQLGEMLVTQKKWARVNQVLESAAAAANYLLADVSPSPEDSLSVLSSLSRWSMLAPLSILELGDTEEALRLAELGKSRLMDKALNLRSFLGNSGINGQIETLQMELIECEDALASKILINRKEPLKKAIVARQKIHDLVTNANFKDGSHSEFLIDTINQIEAKNLTLVFPLIYGESGALIIVKKREKTTSIETIRFHEKDNLSGLSKIISNNKSSLEKAVEESVRISDLLSLRTRSLLGDLFLKKIKGFTDTFSAPENGQVVLFPQGALSGLPFASAYNSDKMESFIDTMAYSLCPSIKSLQYAQSQKNLRTYSDHTLAMVSNPSINNSRYKRLGFAEIESRLAKSFFSSSTQSVVLGESEATQAATLSALSNASIWHFATHGKFNESQPLKSRLLLSGDDSISVESLLETRGLTPPELVICSACETGLNSNRIAENEFLGLASGFLQLGALGVIVTLWKINDVSASLVIGRFYEAYLKEQKPAVEALRIAQLWLRDSTTAEIQTKLEKWKEEDRITDNDVEIFSKIGLEDSVRPFEDPKFWAAFVYYGV